MEWRRAAIRCRHSCPGWWLDGAADDFVSHISAGFRRILTQLAFARLQRRAASRQELIRLGMGYVAGAGNRNSRSRDDQERRHSRKRSPARQKRLFVARFAVEGCSARLPRMR